MEQGIDVRGVTFETPFFNAVKARAAADMIGLPLTVRNITEPHLTMLKAPRYGYGKNMNPCIDCHTLMLKFAGELMEEIGADFILTGEVLGQRPMSQGRQSLHVVAKNSGFQEYIVRPLSAKLLPETKPEREGILDRQKLLSLQGRGRKEQMKMAAHFGITRYDSPAGGCLLTDPEFSKRLKDLFYVQKNYLIRDIELLKVGRHFRIAEGVKVIVGRHRADNEIIRQLSDKSDMLIQMTDFPGPMTLVPSGCNVAEMSQAASLCALYSDAPNDQDATAVCTMGDTMASFQVKAAAKEDAAQWIIR
jgi:tRNA U34 2-thiouridine synthase MnmA/TrmU